MNFLRNMKDNFTIDMIHEKRLERGNYERKKRIYKN